MLMILLLQQDLNILWGTCVKPARLELLDPRGLTLNENKTKLLKLTDTQLDFLSYTFKYKDK